MFLKFFIKPVGRNLHIFAQGMLQLKELHIVNFKNLKQLNLNFETKFTCFVGNNGVGKTNLIDSIYYLSIGKSYFNSIDQQLIRHDETYFNLKGKYLINDETHEIFCAYVNGAKKKIKRNGNDYEKLSDHIGLIPVVIVTPYDNELIMGGSEERRKFVDIILSQLDVKYLKALMLYNKTLKQRNAQLKYMFESEMTDATLIDIYDVQLSKNAKYIYEKRDLFVKDFMPVFEKFYAQLSNSHEDVSVQYNSQLADINYYELLKQNFKKDLIANRTTIGPHKDDLDIGISGYPARKYASQGQQKSILLALKLAQYLKLKQSKSLSPILLLDDVFDRLDRNRTSNLMEIISNADFGQVFITDTNRSRVEEIFKSDQSELRFFPIINGGIE